MYSKEQEEQREQHQINMQDIEDEAENYKLTDNENRFIDMLNEIVNKQNNAKQPLDSLSNNEYYDLNTDIKHDLEYTSHCIQDILDELS